MTYTAQDRWDNLNYAKKLKQLAKQAPGGVHGFAGVNVQRAANRIIKAFTFSEQDKAKVITRLIKNGCSSYEELDEEAGFSGSDIRRIVEKLASAGAVELTYTQPLGRGRGRVFIAIAESGCELISNIK